MKTVIVFYTPYVSYEFIFKELLPRRRGQGHVL